MSSNHPVVRTLVMWCLCAALVSGQTAFGQKWGKVSDEELNMAPPKEFPDAAAVVLFNNGEMEISIEHITFERHVRIKVFRKDGAEEAAEVDVVFRDGDNVREFKAHTITTEGKKKKVEDKYEKEVGSGKIVTLTFPAVEDGVILEYKYKKIHRRYHFLDPWYFQDDIPTLKSRFSVVKFPYFNYTVSRNNVPPKAREPKEEEYEKMGEDVTRYTWELENLPDKKLEPMMGAWNTYAISIHLQLVSYVSPKVNYTFTESWSELGKNLSLNHDFEGFAKGKDIADLAASICSEATTIDDTIRSLYRFVRDEIETREEDQKYTFELRNAGDMLTDGHGFSVEKNALLVKLLRSQGITAYPLLIGTRGYSRFNPALKQLSQFNHLVCYIINGSHQMVLDASDNLVTYPYIPDFDLVSGGLVLDGENTEPVEFTPVERESSARIASNVSVRSDGSACCTMAVCLQGYEMARYDECLTDSISQTKIAEKLLDDASMEYDLVSLFASFDDQGDTLHLDVILELPEFAQVAGDNLFLSATVCPIRHNPFTDHDRFFPVDFRYPHTRSRTTTINLPEGMEVADMPGDVDFRIGDTGFTRTSMGNVNVVYVMERFTIEKPLYAPEEYPDLKELFDIVSESASDQIAATASL